jgi:hypothetical protein
MEGQCIEVESDKLKDMKVESVLFICPPSYKYISLFFSFIMRIYNNALYVLSVPVEVMIRFVSYQKLFVEHLHVPISGTHVSHMNIAI